MGQGADTAESPSVAVNGQPVVCLNGAAVIDGLFQRGQCQAQGFTQCGGLDLVAGATFL